MSLNTEEVERLNIQVSVLFSNVINKLSYYDKQFVTTANIIEIVMEVVEATKLSGSSKKDAALELIERYIEYLPDNRKELKENIRFNLRNKLISDTIDLIIKASKQELKINSFAEVVKSEYFKKLIMSCFSFCVKK